MHGAAVVVVGRIVEHADDPVSTALFRQLDAPEEPSFFPLQDGGVVGGEFPRRLRDPAPRACERDISHFDAVVVEKFESTVGSAGHLGDGVPPVVVVSADDDLPSWEGCDPIKIGHGFGKVIAPREVAGDDDRVFWFDGLHPGFVNLFFVVFPVFSENIHRLRRWIPGEVEIAECV